VVVLLVLDVVELVVGREAVVVDGIEDLGSAGLDVVKGGLRLALHVEVVLDLIGDPSVLGEDGAIGLLTHGFGLKAALDGLNGLTGPLGGRKELGDLTDIVTGVDPARRRVREGCKSG